MVQARGEAGLKKAMFVLGVSYDNGEGIAVDNVESFKWYNRAAEAGFVEAMFNIGVYYYMAKVSLSISSKRSSGTSARPIMVT